MPYPYQISASAFISNPIFTPGPYSHGGALYVVLQSHPSGTGDYVHVYKSSDAGQTWAEQDSANKKNYYQSNTNSPVDTFRFGSKLYITYVPFGGTPGATQLHIAEFDMASDTWGTVITGGPTPGDDMPFKTVVLSDGLTLRTIFTDQPASHRRVRFATWVLGSWGSPVTLFDPGVDETTVLFPGNPRHYDLHGVCVDSEDNIAVLCHNRAGVNDEGTSQRFRRIAVDASVGSFVVTGSKCASALPGPYGGTPVAVPLTGADDSFAFPVGLYARYNTASAFPYHPGMMLFGPGATPASIRTDEINEFVQASSAEPFASLVRDPDSGSLFLYWASFGANWVIKRACTKLRGDWSAPTTVFDSAGAGKIQAICTQVVNTNKVGIVFAANADNGSDAYRFPHYWQEDVPTCSAVGCPTGGAAQGALYAIY